jgi:hypothetical protein
VGQHDVGLGLSAQRVDVSQSRKILAEILAGVPDDEQAKPAPDQNPGIAGGNTARVYHFDVARLTAPAWRAKLFAEVPDSSIGRIAA